MAALKMHTAETGPRTRTPEHRAPRRRIIVGATAVLVTLVVAGVFVAWDRSWRRAGPANPGTNCPQLVTPRRHPPLAAIGVHRVALIGDSIMWQASCAIGNSLAGLGIETSRHAVPATGLLNGSVDWIAQTQRILAAEKPDIVIAIFVGNYPAPPARDAAGAPITVDSQAFFAAWQARAVQLSGEVHAAHARLYWVSPPPIAWSVLAHADRLFDGYRAIAGDHILESGRVLAGPGNQLVGTKESCGQPRTLRSVFDGVHLSDDGARIYGEQIAHDLSSQIGLLTSPRPC